MRAAPVKGERIAALDWVKGALVALMVAYHTLNYARFASFQYLAFLPPSFIFITGFLLTNNYFARYNVRDWRLHRRLQFRGTKLILLYTLLNLSFALINSGRQRSLYIGPAKFVDNWQALFFFPDLGRGSFIILLSIGYLLLLSPLLLLLRSLKMWLVPAFAAGLVALCCYLEWVGLANYHINMIGAGVLGMAFGIIPLEKIGLLARRWGVVVPLYFGYRVCDFLVGNPYLVQSLGVCASLLLLYGVALVWSPGTFLYQQVVLLGRYSLFGYIFHLGVLQIIFRLPLPLSREISVMLIGPATLIVTWLTTKLIEKLRATTPAFDAAYKAVFA